MVRYAEALSTKENRANFNPPADLTRSAAPRAFINIPILYVFLLSYVFTAKKLVNKYLWPR